MYGCIPHFVPGVVPGARLTLLGSYQSELQQVQASEGAASSLRLPSFEHEAKRVAQRRSGASSSVAAAVSAGEHFRHGGT